MKILFLTFEKATMAKRRMTKINIRPKFNNPILGSQNEVSLADLDVFSSVPTQGEVEGESWDKVSIVVLVWGGEGGSMKNDYLPLSYLIRCIRPTGLFSPRILT